MSKLICPDCRHENEPERIYCHSCGARLNRTALMKEQTVAKVEDTVQTQKRLRRMIHPRGVLVRHYSLQFGKVLVGACLAAALIQMILPPELPARTMGMELGPQIGLDLETAVMNHQGGVLSYTEDQVNAYLVSALKRKRAALDKPLLHFEGGFAAFDEGVFRMTAARSFFGYSLYTRADYRVSVQNGQLTADSCGGMVGRLPIHPEIAKYTGVMFADIWKALEQDRKGVAKLSAIAFHPKTVVLTAPLQ